MKRNKGITLIALIITIILMLILVAVTVAIAVDGGIFRNARDASVKTEKKSLYETIVSAMKISNDGDILIKETAQGAKATIEEDKTKDNEIDRPTTIEYDDNTNPTYAILTVEGNTGTYMYKITKSEIMFYEAENGNVEEDTLAWYEFHNVNVNGTQKNEKNIIDEAGCLQQGEGLNIYFIVNDSSGGIVVLEENNEVAAVYMYARHSDYIYTVTQDYLNEAITNEELPSTAKLKTWYKDGEEYTGEFPFFDVEIDYEYGPSCCDTYVARLKEQFTYTQKWYDIEPQEETALTNAGKVRTQSMDTGIDLVYTIYSVVSSKNQSENGVDVITYKSNDESRREVTLVRITIGEEEYLYDLLEDETHWIYRKPNVGRTVYTGAFPISNTDLSNDYDINSTSYFNRLIASFSNS